MDTLKTLNEAFAGKKDAYKAILALGDALTLDKIAEARALKADLDNLQNRITEFGSVGEMKSAADGYESFLNDPVRTVPFDGAPAAAGKGGFDVVGSVESGNSYFETRNGVRELVYEDGAGIYGEKAWKAITDPDYKKPFRHYLRHGKDGLDYKARKLLEEGADTEGGYTVPIDSMINRVVERKPTPTRLRGMVETVNCSREYLEMLKLNYANDNIYSTGFRVTKTGENPGTSAAAQVNDSGLFGTIKVPVHTFYIRGLLTRNMIEDSALNLEQWLSDKFNQTIEILYDDKIVNGVNRMEPQGLVNAATATPAGQGTDDPKISSVKTGSASAVTADSLINLAMDVPEQYEENCKFFFNKTSTFKAIRALKDTQNRYLFGAGYQDSGLATPYRPTDLIGYPYVFSGLFPNVAASAFPVFFGDPKGYLLANRVGFSVQVLREVYAELGQVAVVGRVRFGGQVIEPWRLRALLVSA